MTEELILEKKADFSHLVPETLLFVCTGNTCRSPMAASLFNFLFPDRGQVAVSCGIAADMSPISENAVIALEKRGVESTPQNNYKAHISRTVTREQVSSADRIIGITSRHAMALISAFPEYAEKIEAMPFDISDPYGGSIEDYIKCLSDIEKALLEMFK